MIQFDIISVNSNLENYLDNIKPFPDKHLRYLTRRKYVEEFKKNNQDLNFNIIDAVTPGDYIKTESIVLYKNEKYFYNDIHDIHISNNLSHYNIFSIPRDSFVLEDDVILNREQLLNLSELTEKFQLIDDGMSILYCQISAPWRSDAPEKSFNNIINIDENFNLMLDGDFSGTAGYFISKKTKEYLLNKEKIILPADQYLDYFRKKGELKYYIPKYTELMIRLNTELNYL